MLIEGLVEICSQQNISQQNCVTVFFWTAEVHGKWYWNVKIKKTKTKKQHGSIAHKLHPSLRQPIDAKLISYDAILQHF